MYILFIPWHFPLHESNSIKGASLEAELLFKEKYPAVYNHLLKYKFQLENRNKAETGIRYEWYALQRYGSNYWQEFDKPKIIYPNMTKFMPFVYDKRSFMINDKGFIITGENLEFLTAFLNSNIFKFCFRESFPELQGGTRELRKVFFEKTPIMKVDAATNNSFKKMLKLFEENQSNGLSTSEIEENLQAEIYKLYDLSLEEIKIINDYESALI